MLTAGFLPVVEEKGLVGCVCKCRGGTSVILPGSLQCWVSPCAELGQLTGPHNISSSCKEDVFHCPHLFGWSEQPALAASSPQTCSAVPAVQAVPFGHTLHHALENGTSCWTSTSGWQGVGQDDPLRSLPTTTSVGFCKCSLGARGTHTPSLGVSPQFLLCRPRGWQPLEHPPACLCPGQDTGQTSLPTLSFWQGSSPRCCN